MSAFDPAERRTYLGATDIAAVLGVSPFRSPIDVWIEKRGGEGQPETERMRAGTLLEDVICQMYEEDTGRRLIHRREAVHPRHAFIRVHPDRIVIGEPGGMDAKFSEFGHGYGEPGTDQVPPHVRVQCLVYSGVLRREWWDVGLFRGAPPLAIYHLPHDAALYEEVIDFAAGWWQRHIVEGEEPEPDGSAGYRDFIARKYPRTVELEIVATAEQALLIEELRTARDTRAAAEKREAELLNRVAASMGEATVLLSPLGKVTFRPAVAPRWKSIAEAVANEAMVALEPYVAADIEGRAKPSPRFWPAKEAA
jgi:predicted phage-related endonuclease